MPLADCRSVSGPRARSVSRTLATAGAAARTKGAEAARSMSAPAQIEPGRLFAMMLLAPEAQPARKLAFKWAETAEQKLDMECTYEEGKTSDLVTFTRSGVNGELKVTKDAFELDARLGFLLGAFKDRIESEIVKNLDELLAQPAPERAAWLAALPAADAAGRGPPAQAPARLIRPAGVPRHPPRH